MVSQGCSPQGNQKAAASGINSADLGGGTPKEKVSTSPDTFLRMTFPIVELLRACPQRPCVESKPVPPGESLKRMFS
ncbi:hypothetical protein V1478_013846 [Vespula squamosa]|uniref:Uncharacterized protein n=1 Tax=Vespula squamosa TaxID=30214 RepID=A0ABD2A8Q9_VESSQ